MKSIHQTLARFCALICLASLPFGRGSFVFAQTITITSGGTETAPTTTVTNTKLPAALQITNVVLKGNGTTDHPFEIGSVAEWTAFATIANDYTQPNANAKLTADITFSGNHLQPGENPNWSYTHNNNKSRIYKETLDGQGHTITLNQQATGGSNGTTPSYGGLFWHVGGATIKNLRVAGKIETKNSMSGAFIQNVNSTVQQPVTIENCISSVNNHWAGTSDNNYEYSGSFVGDVHHDMTLNIKNCLTDGQFTTNDNHTVGYSGGFVGITSTQSPYTPSTVNIKNSYFHPENIDNKYINFSYFCNRTEDLTINQSYYSLPSTYTVEEQVAQGTAAPAAVADLLAGLNGGDNASLEDKPWIVHNDTVYLKTFAKYVHIDSWTYGSPNDPTVVGNNGNATVTYKYKVQGTGDNTYTTTKPTAVGNYTVLAIVPATDSWNGWTSTMNFTISKAAGAISAAPTAASPTYNGNAQALLATNGTATGGTFYYRKGTTGDWSTTPPTETAPGTYNVYYYVTPDGNHTSIDAFGSAESPIGPIEVTIGKAALTIKADDKNITYGDAVPTYTVTYDGFVNGESSTNLSGTLSIACDYAQYGDVGDYAITPSGFTSTNYAITYTTGNLTVAQKEVGLTWNTTTSFTYDGNSHCLTANATGMVNGDVIGVTVTGEQTNVGNHTAEVSGITGDKSGNYKLPSTGTTQSYTITQKALTITAKPQTITYGGSISSVVADVTTDGLVTGDALNSITLTKTQTAYSATPYVNDITPSAAVVKKGDSDVTNNYSITYNNGNLTINKKTAELSWSATSFDYDGSAKEPTATVANLEAGDDCNVTVNVEGEHKAVGFYTATATTLSNDNYALPTLATQDYQIVRPMTGIEFTASKHWNTYCAFENLATPAGMTAYIVTGTNGNLATTSEIGYIPLGVGVLLYSASTGSGFKASAYTGTAGSFTTNKLVGVTTATAIAAEAGYVLYGDAFVLTLGGTLPANRCYLPVSGPATTRSFGIDGGDGTTFIDGIQDDQATDGQWFDMQGRRIDKPKKKGLYIRDGKKVVIK